MKNGGRGTGRVPGSIAAAASIQRTVALPSGRPSSPRPSETWLCCPWSRARAYATHGAISAKRRAALEFTSGRWREDVGERTLVRGRRREGRRHEGVGGRTAARGRRRDGVGERASAGRRRREDDGEDDSVRGRLGERTSTGRRRREDATEPNSRGVAAGRARLGRTRPSGRDWGEQSGECGWADATVADVARWTWPGGSVD
mmetsp:Transcript_30674/g.65176  ORF Transcript_30674/g.65176 Transcript_30674/m.65176 type:complete len:202 (+) Transcript_30674:2-607(+)